MPRLATIAATATVALAVWLFSRDPVTWDGRNLWVVLAAVTSCIAYVSAAFYGERRGRTVWTTALGLFGIVGVTLAVGEIFCSFQVASHTNGQTLANRLWFQRFWRLNDRGYRDRDWSADELAGKRKIFVLGDSFVAGYGIEDPSKRFPDLLQARLGDAAAVVNLGVNGADTVTEHESLLNYPTPPDAVVLAYFGNDIQPAAVANGTETPKTAAYPSWPMRAERVLWRSFLLNFVYWKLPSRHYDDWWQFFQASLVNEDAWKVHLEDLDRVVAYARVRQIPLVVVAFPFLHDLPASHAYLRRIDAFFTARQVPVVDVTPLVQDLTVEERIVSLADIHPSELVHARVAAALQAALAAAGPVPRTPVISSVSEPAKAP